jgi:hypothetical protein
MERLFILLSFVSMMFCNIVNAQILQRINPNGIQFDVNIIDHDDRYAYVPPGDCGQISCIIQTSIQNYSCDIPVNETGEYQDFWINVNVPGQSDLFYLLCRFLGPNDIYITRSDPTWQLSLPDPQQDILQVIPPAPAKPIRIDFDRQNGTINLLDAMASSSYNIALLIIPFCETENSDDDTGNPALRTVDTGANTAPLASRTAANAGLITGRVATPATPGLSQSLLRFPNPISASLTITWGNEAPADTELSLWSLDGRRIAQGSLGASDADYTFPTAHLPAGVYLLRVVSAGQIPQTYKIVKN